MSGWSTFITTILAALRVVPPDFIMPATESAPRINDTGPDALPPCESDSRFERKGERLTPEPEPPLKIMPSFVIHSKIDFMWSSTERIKQAEHCGVSVVPTLNQTGLLNEAF